jgi:hypothetical protein
MRLIGGTAKHPLLFCLLLSFFMVARLVGCFLCDFLRILNFVGVHFLTSGPFFSYVFLSASTLATLLTYGSCFEVEGIESTVPILVVNFVSVSQWLKKILEKNS